METDELKVPEQRILCYAHRQEVHGLEIVNNEGASLLTLSSQDYVNADIEERVVPVELIERWNNQGSIGRSSTVRVFHQARHQPIVRPKE